jgi:ketosteroid isomerase-like protein
MHTRRHMICTFALCCALAIGGAGARAQSPLSAKDQVIATELAFARTMADRDLAKFSSFVAREAVFLSGKEPLTGKSRITDAWSRFFVGSKAPFSWEADRVEVLKSGTLALSSGPVRDPSGKLIGRFTSIWRREAPDTWRIVFDEGNEVCTP